MYIWLYSCIYGCINVYVVVFLFNIVVYVFLLLLLCTLIVCLCNSIVPAGTLRLSWLRFFRAFSSVVSKSPAKTVHGPHSSKNVCVILFIVCFVLLCVLCVCVCVCVCKCVLYYCRRVATQLQLTNKSYHIISYIIISKLFTVAT